MELTGAVRWICGWVWVEAQGGYPERLLNSITAAGLPVWGVQRRQESLRFSCLARDYRRLRSPARRACVHMRVRHKWGLPFWIHRYRHRRGLLVGLVVYALVLGLLSPRIWAVQVVGNTTTPAAEILEVAQQMGVAVGSPTKELRIKELEIEGLRQLPTLSFITVNPSGSVARVEVREHQPTPEVLDLSQPSDMVALRDGQILSMEVLGGYRVVKDGEAVRAGDLLITGRRETETGVQLYRSYGQVWAITRRYLSVAVPLTYEQAVPDGFVAVRPTLTFLWWHLPLYGGGTPGEGYRRHTATHFLQANGLTLPLGVSTDYYVRMESHRVARTPSQAAKLAARQLAQQEEALFGQGNFQELSRQEGVQGSDYVVQVTYACRENIAREVPID